MSKFKNYFSEGHIGSHKIQHILKIQIFIKLWHIIINSEIIAGNWLFQSLWYMMVLADISCDDYMFTSIPFFNNLYLPIREIHTTDFTTKAQKSPWSRHLEGYLWERKRAAGSHKVLVCLLKRCTGRDCSLWSTGSQKCLYPGWTFFP